MSVPGQAYEGGQQCTHGWGKCGRTDTHPYAAGPRCPDHTPAKLAGLPEPDSKRYCASYRCYCGHRDCPASGSYVRPLEPITANVIDLNAIKSGKRRSSKAAYQEAQQAQTRGGAA